jgi:hypothetical protein
LNGIRIAKSEKQLQQFQKQVQKQAGKGKVFSAPYRNNTTQNKVSQKNGFLEWFANGFNELIKTSPKDESLGFCLSSWDYLCLH